MLWRADYTADSGKVFPYVSLAVDDEKFLPDVLKAFAIPGQGFCGLPAGVKLRHVILTEENGGNVRIEYPFRPDTSEWFAFWQEIKTNPLIISSKGVGETIKI